MDSIKSKFQSDVESLINWRALSLELTGNPNQLTRTRIGKKYEPIIDVLRDKITEWKLFQSPTSAGEIHLSTDIIHVGRFGVLHCYTDDNLTNNRDVFRLLSYNPFEDVYRLEFGTFGGERRIVSVPGNEYPQHEFEEDGKKRKMVYKPLNL